MTSTGELADFALAVDYEDLSPRVREELRKRILDSVGIAIGALGATATSQVRSTVTALQDGESCRLWGTQDSASTTGAAMYNTALVRYLDFMDSFLAPGETPHPSDNIAAAIAVAEADDHTGRRLLEAVATAYEVQGELAWNAPVRDRGWDHVTHTVISAAVGAGVARGLDRAELRNAIGIAGTAHNALRVTRTGGINEWKGIASANAARNAVYAVELADRGMEGPTNLFEGQKGWKDIIAGEFSVDLDRGCTRVFDTMTKRYVAETYAQSAVEGIIELATEHDIDHENVEQIHLETFHGAALIIGGGEGDRYEVETKAQADHSLPYMLAAALIDRELTVDSYDPDRIQREDVQTLLRTVDVEEDPALTDRFEAGEMPADITITLDDGSTYHVEKAAFAGHPNDPMDWDSLEAKFETLTRDRYDDTTRTAIIDAVKSIDDRPVGDLVALLD